MAGLARINGAAPGAHIWGYPTVYPREAETRRSIGRRCFWHRRFASTAFVTMLQLRLEAQKKMLTFLASNTFWSRVILRPAIFQAPATRRRTSRRAPT